MRAEITGFTVDKEVLENADIDLMNNESVLNMFKTFSGKNAGVCYMGDSYFKIDNNNVTDPEKAFNRFMSTINRGHHSIADHVNVTVVFEGISKMLAIVLNSTQNYATSEKSGRYTVMTGNSKQEQSIYEKWCKLFEKRVLEIEPDYNDKFIKQQMIKKLGTKMFADIKNGKMYVADKMTCIDSNIHSQFNETLANVKEMNSLPSKKIAQENARYVLSVFTKSTSMAYTTSLRQWSYIYDWCMKAIKSIESKREKSDMTKFELELMSDFGELLRYIEELGLKVDGLNDNKDRSFDFLGNIVLEDELPEYTDEDQCYTDSYLVKYEVSFVHIAQEERHRTIKYIMQFNSKKYLDKPRFYVPKMIKDTDLYSEWLEDLNSIKDIYPQATMIDIIETGHIDNFFLKCKERLCSRAQLEICLQTEKLIKLFKQNNQLSRRSKELLKDYISDSGKVYTKCKLCGCGESCGRADKAYTRLF